MIERVDINETIALADSDEVRRQFPGLSLDQRLRALNRCVWLRDGDEFAVFSPKWLGRFDAVVLDIDRDGKFCRDVVDHMFASEGAASLILASQQRDSGTRLRAKFLGPFQYGATGFAWELTRAEWEIAVAEWRIVEPLPIERRKRAAS